MHSPRLGAVERSRDSFCSTLCSRVGEGDDMPKPLRNALRASHSCAAVLVSVSVDAVIVIECVPGRRLVVGPQLPLRALRFGPAPKCERFGTRRRLQPVNPPASHCRARNPPRITCERPEEVRTRVEAGCAQHAVPRAEPRNPEPKTVETDDEQPVAHRSEHAAIAPQVPRACGTSALAAPQARIPQRSRRVVGDPDDRPLPSPGRRPSLKLNRSYEIER